MNAVWIALDLDPWGHSVTHLIKGLPRYDPARLAAACEALGARLLVLFGSRSTGSPPPAPESDLDLAVRLDPSGAAPGLWECHQQLAEVFPNQTLDLVLLNDADPLLRHEVMRGGTLLYGEIDEFLEYRAYAYRDFADSADLRELEATLFRKKMNWIRSELHGAA